MAAYYTDAAPVARRLEWPGAAELAAYGTENDLLVAGVPVEGHAPLLEAFRENLTELNQLRSEAFLRSRPVQLNADPLTSARS